MDAATAPLPEAEVRRHGARLKYTNILSFNTRTFALFAAILIFRMPWLYFAFELTVLNVILIYMMWRHERMCRNFVKDLQS